MNLTYFLTNLILFCGVWQEDFPLTPSAVYSKRLLANAEGRFDQDIGEDEDNHGEDPLLAAATSAHHVRIQIYLLICRLGPHT